MDKLYSKIKESLLLSVTFTSLDKLARLQHNLSFSVHYESVMFFVQAPWPKCLYLKLSVHKLFKLAGFLSNLSSIHLKTQLTMRNVTKQKGNKLAGVFVNFFLQQKMSQHIVFNLVFNEDSKMGSAIFFII
jgi:hypothetical protein